MDWRVGIIDSSLPSWPGCDHWLVTVAERQVKALAYTDMVGALTPGDRVALNMSALERGLGTGGYAYIIAPLDQMPELPPSTGHIMKARYTPQQMMVQTVEEENSAHHEALRSPIDMAGMPVVVADLHSALPAVIAGVRIAKPGARIAYVMTDGASLPAAFSRQVSLLRDAEELVGTITCGQAFGGDLEATSLANAIIASRLALEADVVIVSQGPGNVGTGTHYGFSGLDTIWHLYQAQMVGARPIAVIRASSADKRPRHFGLSHHCETILNHLPHAVTVPYPAPTCLTAVDAPALARAYAELTDALHRHRRHHLSPVDEPELYQALAQYPVPMRTMGRDLTADPLSFLCAGAAGVVAGYDLA
ncbi:MAG: DUF3866 family protein [Bowdeniella nasicola]|nr:DUF3866 family protein [Bowdeniella nasicola]